MDAAEFESFVARLQQTADRNPSGYRLRVLALAIVGYAYLAALVIVLLLLFALTLAAMSKLHAAGIKLAFIVGGFLLLVLRSLWVRLQAPTGVAVTRTDSPDLFLVLDGLRDRLRTPAVHHVLVTADFNAAVVQIPRLGLFGWHRNYVILGLPLMQVLTTQQFEAVLAHELGHLAGGHARTGNWIYRLRLMLLRLNAALSENRHWGSFMVQPFFNWYVPYFHAYSFPLARANEYEADAASARLTTPRSAAQALTAVSVVGAFLDQRFWPGIYSQAAERSQPGFAPFSAMPQAVTQEMSSTDKERWLHDALSRETSAADTHPALSDRLHAIGAPAELALADRDGAADQLLGETRAKLESQLNDEWLTSVARAWEQRHRQVIEGRQRLSELTAKAANEALPESEALERASLEENVGAGAAAALEQRRALHALAPESVAICFALGRQLIEAADESGVPLLEQAAERDPAALPAVSELLRDYYWQRGQKESAYHWHRRLSAELPRLEAQQKERQQITLKDKLLPHHLDEPSLARLRGQLARIAAIRRAYLVRKVLPQSDGDALLVLGFSVTAFYELHRAAKAHAAQEEILSSCEFPGEALVVNVDGENYRFARKLRRCQGARII